MKNKYYIVAKDVFISLKNGMELIIDLEDLERVKKYSWYPLKHTAKYTSVQGSSSKTVNGVKKSFTFRLHRYLLNITDSSILIDHEDRNPLNNRRSNLRTCSRSQSSWNTGLFSSNKSSKYKGVTFNKSRQKWVAQMTINNTQKGLGYFRSEIEAAEAYNKAVMKHRDSFAFSNTIN